jgi:hypothetical protein
MNWAYDPWTTRGAGPSWTREQGRQLGSPVSGAPGLQPLGACCEVGKMKRSSLGFRFAPY